MKMRKVKQVKRATYIGSGTTGAVDQHGRFRQVLSTQLVGQGEPALLGPG